jgi:hypothetical protein
MSDTPVIGHGASYPSDHKKVTSIMDDSHKIIPYTEELNRLRQQLAEAKQLLKDSDAILYAGASDDFESQKAWDKAVDEWFAKWEVESDG